MLLCVFGATGQQGGAVVRYFKNRCEVRGVTRNKNSEAAQKLGVGLVEADLNDLESVKRALEGATHVFATTDSNKVIHDAVKNGNAEGACQLAYEAEMKQGRNLAEALRGFRGSVVWSSLTSPKKRSKYVVPMWDAKEEIKDLLEEIVPLRTLILGFFLTNALAVPDLYAPRKLDVYELALPMSGDVPVPHADLEDAGKWVEELFERPAGTVMVGATAVLSWKEWVEMWGEVNGVPVRYRRAGDEWAKGGISDAVLEEFKFVEEYGFAEGVYPEAGGLRASMRRVDWSALL